MCVCRQCGRVFPFRDDTLYLKDSFLAVQRHYEEVFPRCPDCGLWTVPYWVYKKKVIYYPTRDQQEGRGEE